MSEIGVKSEAPNGGREQWGIEKRWTTKLVAGGWTPVVNVFLEHYASLNPPITTPEAMLLIQLMRHKRTEKAPYPSFKTLGKRMGISPTAARGHARKLQRKKYLFREVRIGETNIFHLDPLFEALEAKLDELAARKSGQDGEAD